MLKGFLWCQGDLTKGKAKVSWDALCKLKDQGGLGLKNLGILNEVLMIKHLWNVAIKKDTLWVKWIMVERLKGRSIWEVQSDCNSSVGWKNILSLRDKTREHVLWKIGNGRSVNVWHDRWCSVSPLNLGKIQIPNLNAGNKDTAVWVASNGQEQKSKINNVWKERTSNDTKVD
nr:RNA-directed DNA polymerase, eukaryota, reverse transcriptase zinc-binding domain protein [Tanacetum cinerariifolium]GFA47591.1 RNA-directed DNA polymerase, eukaryota, reverse transcriptase zinc-binding domain protein [Tanacetum cinerariifolium]